MVISTKVTSTKAANEIKSSRAVVCAYHDVGYYCLEELLRQGVEVLFVYTHDDNPQENIWFHSVRTLAEAHGIPCLTSDINSPENVARVRADRPDFLFSFYYRNMLTPEVLAIPARGALNMHGSLLPKYRGRVPINWVVINGETETGATLHYMEVKPDAGDIVDQEKVPILFTDTALDVFHKVTKAAVRVLTRSIPQLVTGTARRVPMDLSAGSYFGGRKPEDGKIDWKRSAVEIYNLIRGVTHPYPGAFTFLGNKKIFIWQAWPREKEGTHTHSPGEIVSRVPLLIETGAGLLELRSLQYERFSEVSGTAFSAVLTDEDVNFI